LTPAIASSTATSSSVTAIAVGVSAVSPARLVVYDLQGREVAVLVNERKDPGVYSLRFDGARLSSGIYLLRLTAGNFSQTRAMVMEK